MMNISKNNLIVKGLGILAFIILSVVFTTPNDALAYITKGAYTYTDNKSYYTYIPPAPNTSTTSDSYPTATQNNPTPVIYSINPNQTKPDSDAMTLDINGENFTPGSVARWNSSDRVTTYVNTNKLKMKLTKADLSGRGEYLVTVFNPAPGGGFSNSAVFTIGDAPVVAPVVSNTVIKTTEGSVLGASAVGASFFPFGLIGWIILAILILLVVIVWRRVYVSDKEKNAPLKHA
jgi:hypothetical protein